GLFEKVGSLFEDVLLVMGSFGLRFGDGRGLLLGQGLLLGLRLVLVVGLRLGLLGLRLGHRRLQRLVGFVREALLLPEGIVLVVVLVVVIGSGALDADLGLFALLEPGKGVGGRETRLGDLLFDQLLVGGGGGTDLFLDVEELGRLFGDRVALFGRGTGRL